MSGKMCTSIGIFGIFLILGQNQAFAQGVGETCNDALGLPGHCVHFKKCQQYMDLLLGPEDFGKISKYTINSVCSFADRETTVCCPDYETSINLDYNTSEDDICNDALGQRGLCLPIKLCKPLVNLILRTNASEIVTKYTQDSVCVFDEDATTVCCPSNGRIEFGKNDNNP
ncbi:uncharacterized protein [Venturia canescens]|uniref:uncharacterized protein n=1 Tax=Venturia canescens TaxID=32260 RepID=UPI001C9CB51C|nr:uncharacterized protein LOC122411970 [Venturia canescens]XP_043277064.1 uncharacterized protein LOC122411970 [Venturia canescens]